MIIAIVGSRNFNDYELVKKALDPVKNKITGIISGGAKGADSLAETYARQNGIITKIFLPDWETHGNSAGFIRNTEIVGAAQLVIAFWDGKSKGTKHSIDIANRLNKPLKIIKYAN